MPDQGPTLEALGWTPALQECLARFPAGFEPGRVAVEDKHYYTVVTPHGELTSQISGRLLHDTRAPADLPKVGDWVVLTPVPMENKGIIHHVLPRRTRLSRKVAGREVEEQVLATNIDAAFVVQALDGTFNPALLQRHLVMVLESGAKPIVVLNKADLCAQIPERMAQAARAAPGVAIVVVSAKTTLGMEELARHIYPGHTIVFIGSSGVGKSTLINDLYGEDIQATLEVRVKDAKGRHTTTWRELIMLPGGGMVIDTPGMREFQMWMADEGMRGAFSDLEALAVNCHFRDCTHTVETRCAVLGALASGQIPAERYHQFIKLQKELTFLEAAQSERTWAQRRRSTRVAQRAFNRVKRPKRR